MRLAALALTATIVGGAPVSAGADDPNFAAFHRICIATRGERDAALGAAEAEGFVRPPKAFFDRADRPPVALEDLEVRMKLVQDGLQFVFVGGMTAPFQDHYRAIVCVMGINPLSPASEQAASAWGGVAPVEGDPDHQMQLFVGKDGAHKTTDPDHMDLAARSGELQMLGAGRSGDLSLMMYGFLRPVSGPQASSGSPSQSDRRP
jgi:hypothetical protein